MPGLLPDEPLRHNYMKKLVHLFESGALPEGLARVEVRHDDGCPALRPGRGYCTCDPDLLVDGRLAGEASPAAQRRRRRRGDRKKGRRP